MTARPLFLFSPGAGAPSTSRWMTAWAARLGTLGDVVPLDYPYMLAGRKSPDRLPALVLAHRNALGAAREGRSGPVFLAGKSMGGRVGCHVSLDEPVDGLICFGYPLRGAGPRAPLRDEVLRKLTVPILFVQGTRDALCPLPLLESVRTSMTARSELHVVEGGDHSLEITKTELRRRGVTQEQVDTEIRSAVARFTGTRDPASNSA